MQPEAHKVCAVVGHLLAVIIASTRLALSNLILMVWEDLHKDSTLQFSILCVIDTQTAV